MKYLVADFFEDFECVGGSCSNTCCADWSIPVDDETAAVYRKVSGELGKKLQDHLMEKNGITYFRLTEQSRCPFLTEENLCELYQKLGKEYMCRICTQYPRSAVRYGDIYFNTLTLSCPEVARMMLERTESLEFDFAEKEEDEKQEELDWELFNTLIGGLTRGADMLQNRTLPLSVRLRMLVLFTSALQQRIDAGMDASDILECFSSPENYAEYAQLLSAFSADYSAKISAFRDFCRNFERFSERDQKCLKRLLGSLDSSLDRWDSFFMILESPEYDIQYEHFCIYYLFRYYMSAMKTRKPLRQTAILIYILNILKCFAVLRFDSAAARLPLSEQIDIFSTLSRVFDHSADDKNFERLYDIYGEKADPGIDSLMGLA